MIVSIGETNAETEPGKVDNVGEHELAGRENLDFIYAKAQSGDAESMLRIADLYVAHARGNADYEKAFAWAQKAETAGKIEACFLLGEMLQYGVGCKKNICLARQFYIKLLRQKNLSEIFGPTTIGNLYENYAELQLQKKTIKGLYLAKCYYQKAIDVGGVSCREKLDDTLQEWDTWKEEKQGKVLFLVSMIMALIIAVVVVIRLCREPARHLEDSIINKALTVMDAEDVKDDSVVKQKDDAGTMWMEEGDAEAYYLATEEEIENLSLQICQIQSAVATSEQMPEVGAQYGIVNSYDGKNYTNWQENEKDAGIGQKLSYTFQGEVAIKVIAIRMGNARSEKAYRGSNRPASLVIRIGDEEISCSFPDENETQYIVFKNPLHGDKIQLEIGSVYQGNSEKNITSISEIAFYQAFAIE